MLGAKALLCLAFQLLDTGVLNRSVILVLLCGVCAVYTYGYYVFQPFADQRVNQCFVAGTGAFAWATLCLIVQLARGQQEVGLKCETLLVVGFRLNRLCLAGLRTRSVFSFESNSLPDCCVSTVDTPRSPVCLVCVFLQANVEAFVFVLGAPSFAYTVASFARRHFMILDESVSHGGSAFMVSRFNQSMLYHSAVALSLSP